MCHHRDVNTTMFLRTDALRYTTDQYFVTQYESKMCSLSHTSGHSAVYLKEDTVLQDKHDAK